MICILYELSWLNEHSDNVDIGSLMEILEKLLNQDLQSEENIFFPPLNFYNYLDHCKNNLD